MKIAFLLPSLSGGGAERVASLLARELDSRPGVECHLVVFDSRIVRYPTGSRFVDLGVPKASGMRELLNVFRRIRALSRWRRRVGVDATTSLLFGANLVNVLAGGGGKKIVSVRIFYFDKRRTCSQLVVDLLRRAIYALADKTVAVSGELAGEFSARKLVRPGMLASVPNPYDLEFIAESASEALPGEWAEAYDRKTVVVTMGRLSYQKGQGHLIRAFAAIAGAYPGAMLVILGEGPDREGLEGLARDLGLEARILFAGFRGNPFPFLANADLFAFPSLYEGFCNVMVEAMACGLPVLSSDCRSGPREILDDRIGGTPVSGVENARWGVLVPVCDGRNRGAREPLTREERLLADGLASFLGDAGLRADYSERSRRRCRDFRLAGIADLWMGIFEGNGED